MDYNSTLSLPDKAVDKAFPMRANLPVREPELLKKWQDENLYGELRKKNSGKPKFVLHDGPPFSNGDIHMGTAMNKVLKDMINRYKLVSGFDVPYVPGWDNHGMPIESAIIKRNKLDRKKMSIPEFRDACHDFAQDFVNRQMDEFKRLGVVGDWEHPYLTMSPSFEAREVQVFGEMFKKGYIYKGLKPVYWCPHDETALAEAEIEYADDKCTSIYVKFAVKDDKGLVGDVFDVSKTYFVIWTTTTWTLPGNLAIAVNPYEEYAVVKAGDEAYIIAEALVGKTMSAGGIENFEILKTIKGAELEFMTAQHPFIDRESKVLLADYVTMDSGTGCVHTAPGFGAEDYITCRKYGLEMIVPVDDRGYQTEDAGKFAGMFYADSNEAILKDMKESGALFASEEIVHQYPHCWRCKSPIIFRATPQWFCSVDAFKDEAVKACEGIEWLPAWGGDRMVSMIKERADWCISRQRHWGLPIPVFYCEDCKKPVCTDETIEAVSNLFGAEGSNSWYTKDVYDILPKGYKCPHCGGIHFFKETDTLDGWFDSGSSHFAVCENNPDMKWPADIYLEGADQYRGWFQSSMLTAIGAKGEGAPYRTVLTHGWVVDGEGKAMHKSLGNTVDPNDIIKKYGADVLRLWVASSDYRVDVRVSPEILEQLSQTYRKIRNTAKYILGNISGFDPDSKVSASDMLPMDKWIITRLNALSKTVKAAYETYEYHIVYHAVYNFCVVDLSNIYLDVLKDRLYCDSVNSLSRKSAQSAMFMILDTLVRLLAPILAYTSDEIWAAMPHGKNDDTRNVLFNEVNKEYEDYALSQEDAAKWDKLVSIRDDINVFLEGARAEKLIGKSLEAKVAVSCDDEDYEFLSSRAEDLEALLIVSEVEIKKGTDGDKCERFDTIFVKVEKASGEKCERCWRYGHGIGTDADHPTLCHRCASVVKE